MPIYEQVKKMLLDWATRSHLRDDLSEREQGELSAVMQTLAFMEGAENQEKSFNANPKD